MNTPLKPQLHKHSVIGSAFIPYDFRIGNYVASKEWGGYGQIEGIEVLPDRIDFKVKGYIHSIIEGKYFDLEPIILTKEWLIKLGFVKDQETDYRWFLEDWLAYDDDDNTIRISDTWEFGKRTYVHEIQNLYYSLKCIELAVSLS